MTQRKTSVFIHLVCKDRKWCQAASLTTSPVSFHFPRGFHAGGSLSPVHMNSALTKSRSFQPNSCFTDHRFYVSK